MNPFMEILVKSPNKDSIISRFYYYIIVYIIKKLV